MCATDQSMDQSYGSFAKDQSNGNVLYVQRTNRTGIEDILLASACS